MNEQNIYDELPYPDLAFQRTHPNRTAAMAALFGLAPADPERARVLELGCAAGANLLPMGVELPDAEFVGLDLSARQIEAGEAARRAAGIANVTLRQADILDIDASLGRFDYIIAHGLFSWVPEPVQDKILTICRENLASNGVAYVSYNVNPGWYFRSGLRDMMLYHVAGFPDARTRIEQARSLLDFLAAQANPGPYADMLKAEAGLLRRKSDGYIYHEFLEPENHPIRLDQFVAKAREKGLGYLGETEISAMTSSAFKPETMEMLDRISGRDLVRMGQYGDFLANRAFRESLLVHGEQKIDRRIDWRAIRPFWVSTLLTPEDPAFDSTSAQPATFVSPIGTQIRLENPTSKVALAILLKTHPQPLAFDHLLEASRARLGSARAMEQDEEELAKFILFAYGHGFFDVLARPWPCTAAITDQPRTSQLSRLQARSGQSVITLNHRHLDDLSPEYRQLIGLLDGEHTIDQVIDIMFQCVEAQLPEESEAREGDPARSRAMIADSVQQMIASLRNAGLLF